MNLPSRLLRIPLPYRTCLPPSAPRWVWITQRISTQATDLFQSQVGTPISTVSDESVREVFAAKVDDETRELLMQTVTTISVKSKFNGKLQDAFNVLNGLLSDDDTSEEDAE